MPECVISVFMINFQNQTALDVLLTWNESENNKDVEFLREYTKLVAMLKKKMGQKGMAALIPYMPYHEKTCPMLYANNNS